MLCSCFARYRVFLVQMRTAGLSKRRLSEEPLMEEGWIWEDELGVLTLTAQTQKGLESLRLEHGDDKRAHRVVITRFRRRNVNVTQPPRVSQSGKE